jgi:hypothetical protein
LHHYLGLDVEAFYYLKGPQTVNRNHPYLFVFLRVDHGSQRGNGYKLRVKMLTSANTCKQNGDTRTRKLGPGYLNLSISMPRLRNWKTDGSQFLPNTVYGIIA